MALLRLLRAGLGGLAVIGLLAGCQDGRTPEPPPRVPKPKVEREAADPIRTGPAQDRQVTQA